MSHEEKVRMTERLDEESLVLGLSWREATSISNENLSTWYSIAWRCEEAAMRRNSAGSGSYRGRHARP